MTLRARLRPAIPALAALLFASAAALPARAQPAPVDAEGAKAIESGLRDWLGSQIGAVVDLSALPLRVVAGDNSYRLELPLGANFGDGAMTLSEGVLTARLRPLGDTRWAIDSVKIPSPWTMKLDPSLQPKGKSGLSDMTLKVDEQDVHGVLDTSLATTSTFDARIGGYTVLAEGPQGPQATRIGLLTGHAVWQPTSDGLLTMTSLSNAEDYTMQTVLPDGTPVSVGVGHVRTNVTATGVDMAAFGALVRSAAELGAAASEDQKADGKKGMAERPKGVPEAERPKARALVRALAGMMGGITGETSYEDIKADVAGKGATLHRLSIGFDMAAPNGKAEFAWRFGLDGLDSPLIPPGPFREMMPHHLAFTPRVAGIPKDELVALLLQAIDDPDSVGDFMTTMTELLAKSPLKLGIENIALDLGPAKLSGGGGVTVAAMDDITGGGEFRVSGLDALIRRANATPELKQGAPFLIFLKGIGRQEGDVTVWKLSYADNKLLVNDTDMSAMMPGGGGK